MSEYQPYTSYVIPTPALTTTAQSADTDSLLSWTSADEDKDKDKDLISKDEDKHEDLKIGPRGSSRTRTFLEDNDTDVDVFPSQTNLSMANVVTCEYEADEKIVRHEISWLHSETQCVLNNHIAVYSTYVSLYLTAYSMQIITQ